MPCCIAHPPRPNRPDDTQATGTTWTASLSATCPPQKSQPSARHVYPAAMRKQYHKSHDCDYSGHPDKRTHPRKSLDIRTSSGSRDKLLILGRVFSLPLFAVEFDLAGVNRLFELLIQPFFISLVHNWSSPNPFLFQIFSNFLFGPSQPAVYRLLRNPQRLRYPLIRQSVIVAKVNHFSRLRRKTGDRFTDRLGIRRIVLPGRQFRELIDVTYSLLLATNIVCRIPAYHPKPACETAQPVAIRAVSPPQPQTPAGQHPPQGVCLRL